MFKNRKDAGVKLASALKEFENDPNAIVIALPRGGVVVGKEVAEALHLPLDIITPRKIGAPFNPELAIGAITESGEGIFQEDLIEQLGVTHEYIKQAVEKEKIIAATRLSKYRKNKPPRQLKGKTVIIVDDGIATGSTMFAAIKTIKAEKAQKIIVAVPVSPPDTFRRLQKEVTHAIALATPSAFFAVGQFYDHFDQTTDEEVIALLNH